MTLQKLCPACSQVKDASLFATRGGKNKHLLQSHCKACRSQQHKNWANKNPEKVREYRAKDKWTLLKRCQRHGITVEEFWAIFEEQDATCPVCDSNLVAEESAIDHNHKTGDVRGILCKSCNRGLGLLGDNPDNLFRAATYLSERGFYGKN